MQRFTPMERFCEWIILCMLLLAALPAYAQRARGELRIEVHDPQGATLPATAELVSDGNQYRRNFHIAQDGRYMAEDLPFGVYRLSLKAEGFAPWTDVVDIRSEVPIRIAVTLGIAPSLTQVEVSDSMTLLDPNRTGTQYAIGDQALAENNAAQPGRNLSDLVDNLPGWLYEANGVLHPRGSEYDVQYVVNGVPLTENRSPAFAPSLDADDVASMRVLTANFPAEYGRKLGGVIELTTEEDVPSGLHGRLDELVAASLQPEVRQRFPTPAANTAFHSAATVSIPIAIWIRRCSRTSPIPATLPESRVLMSWSYPIATVCELPSRTT